MNELLQLALAIGSIVGAASAVTYWGGRIARSLEGIDEKIGALRQDFTAQAGVVAAHGEKIARIETRQEMSG